MYSSDRHSFGANTCQNGHFSDLVQRGDYKSNADTILSKSRLLPAPAMFHDEVFVKKKI